MSTCRFCGGHSGGMVKYQVRHYAHHGCYLDAGKSLTDLHPWQVNQFPFRVLRDRNMLEVAASHTAKLNSELATQ